MADSHKYFCPVAVLLLVFNRPQHAEAALGRIREVQPPRLYIHCDGPRPDRPEEAEAVARTREILQKIDWPCEVKTLFRDSNKGLRDGVCNAIDWFFDQEPCGIVIEDDCLPDFTFFRFCVEILDLYREDDRVMHIGGSNLIEKWTNGLQSDYFWTQFSLVWGWASWSRAWKKMDLKMNHLDMYIKNNNIRAFSPMRMAQAYLLNKFLATRARKNNSWAYAWFFTILDHEGICIVPSVNLIQNTGIGDPGATNTTVNDGKSAIAARSLSFPLRHPEKIQIDARRERLLFFFTQKPRFRLWIWYVLHVLGLR